jgi:4-hydroxy-tetrahydrodipicolinate synthase
MTRDELRQLIVGAVATVPTPFDDDFNVDNGLAAEATDRWIDQGLVTGKAIIKVAAAMGEGPQLGDDEWPGLLSAVVGAARGRVPVVGAIHSKDTVRSIKHAKQALDLGAVAIQVNPPLYNEPSQDDILRYYGALSDAVDIGIIVYNSPYVPNGRIFIETLRKMVEFENIVAIKWEPGPDADFEEAFELTSTVNIIDNTSDLGDAYRLGARGYTSIGAGAYPPPYVRIWDMLESGRIDEAQAAWEKVDTPLRNFYAKVTSVSGGQGRVTKGMSEIMGYPMGSCRPPSLPLSPDEMAELRALMVGWGWLED